ncbi:MAG: deoxyribodipyrimidine photo-lyase [Acidobacteria bacterium]|nr:deoxyribodipyrimidine photo-lyase [Acidobacteriota bacterium]
MNDRVTLLNDAPLRREARYVLYWAQMNRRANSNHALAFAARLANEQQLPLLVYEGLTCSYPYASDRLHTFVLEGVAETAKRVRKLGAGYVFYLRKTRRDANDILYRLAASAAAVVTDDYPVFLAPAHNRVVPERVGIPYYAVDSSCIVPMRLFEKREYAAYTIRPKIQKVLAGYLEPVEPIRLKRRFHSAVPEFHTEVTKENLAGLVAACEIDHGVKPSLGFRGGSGQAELMLSRFLEQRLRRYAKEKNEPSAHATSELSPYLHFGNISSLEIALRTMEYAAEHKLIAEEFLEELIVRRELAFNFTRHTPEHRSLAALPDWVSKTLAEHAGDDRPFLYTGEEFERAETHDAPWNATQRELLLRGKIHGYYRMYWGKKIIEWARSYEEALEVMIHLHDKYALDGRDPATYTNILWCFGLHDRPWFERPVFGKIRWMSGDGMRRKTDVDAYLRQAEYMERTGLDPFLG